MKEKVSLKETFNVTPDIIYKAWLNSKGHSKMTGSDARCSAKIGGKFTAWEGYITGKNLELIENTLIVQAWRTTEFNTDHEDSKLTVRLKKINTGTELTLTHTNIPEGQTQYKQGWQDFYLKPMKAYFG